MKWKVNNTIIKVYGHTTRSDLDFMDIEPAGLLSFPSTSTASSISSTKSDAESAPPDLDQLFHSICDAYTEWVEKSGRQLPPEWDMPSLVRTVLGEESMSIPGFLTDCYYDVMVHGTNSWFCQEIDQFIDLVHYVF